MARKDKEVGRGKMAKMIKYAVTLSVEDGGEDFEVKATTPMAAAKKAIREYESDRCFFYENSDRYDDDDWRHFKCGATVRLLGVEIDEENDDNVLLDHMFEYAVRVGL